MFVKDQLERLRPGANLQEAVARALLPGDLVDLNTFGEPWFSSVRQWGTVLPHAVGEVVSVHGNEADVHWLDANPEARSLDMVTVGKVTTHPTSALVHVGETAGEHWDEGTDGQPT